MVSDPEFESGRIGLDTAAGLPARVRPTPAERIVAFLEVLLCSDYPSQLALTAVLLSLGFHPVGADGALNLSYVVTLLLIDTVFLLGLILLFLRAHGEQPSTVLFGRVSLVPEVRVGAGLIIAAFGLAIVILGAILQFAPQLHTVENNPLKDLMRRPLDAAIFGVVVVIAGGIREEIQRAFLLHRFEQWLGGGAVGIAVTSVAFGLGHLAQGVDVAIVTACLGAFWGIVYLRRGSALAPIVSHSGFNLLQLFQFLIIGR